MKIRKSSHEEHKEKNSIAFNVSMLYIMNISKLIFPLITLPYLTRMLTTDCYGVVAYVKATMVYGQFIVDFGFMLSAVKSITEVRNSLEKVGEITGGVIAAKGLLSIVAFSAIMIASAFIEILRENLLYTALAFIPVALSALLLEFLFRGMEKMHIITIRYVIMKTISVGLTLLLVKDDGDILWIPVLDILSSLVAVALTLYEVKKIGVRIQMTGAVKRGIKALQISGVYFASEAATTVFGALNTILVGIFMNKTDVAYWAVCLQLVSAVTAMYSPINNGIYPQMIKTKNMRIIEKVIKRFIPLVVLGCIIVLIFAGPILAIVGGAKYADAASVMRCLVPVLFFSFPAMLLGWPTLGAIGRAKETAITTICAAVVQVLGLLVLGFTGHFTIIGIAVAKSVTEVCLMSFRLRYCLKFKDEFNYTYRMRKKFEEEDNEETGGEGREAGKNKDGIAPEEVELMQQLEE